MTLSFLVFLAATAVIRAENADSMAARKKLVRPEVLSAVVDAVVEHDVKRIAAENMLQSTASRDATCPASNFSASHLPANASERGALLAMWEATNGPHWRCRDGWNTSSHVCSWAGVTCTRRGHVIGIVMPWNNLTGRLPPQFELLKHMLVLDFTNPVGHEFGYSTNALSGPLPLQIASWTNLLYLDIGFNQFTGLIPSDYSRLSQMMYFDVSRLPLNGSLPEAIGDTWSKILTIAIHTSNLTGTIPSSYGPGWSSSILLFNVAENHLHGTLPVSFGAWKRIRILDVHANARLGGEIPASFGNMTKLLFVSLNSCAFVGRLPLTLSRWGVLSGFDVSLNSLTGSLPESYSAWEDIRFLGMYSNRLTGTLPQSWSRMSKLLVLGLNSNAVRGTLPDSYKEWRRMKVFALAHNQISGSIPASYFGWSESPDSLALPDDNSKGWPLIQVFELSNNQLKGTVPDSICGATRLRVLALFDNVQLSGNIPSCVLNGSLPSMEDFMVSNNSFTGTLPILGNLTNLTVLAVSHNKFTGHLPNVMGAPQLMTLLFHFNKFEGDLGQLWLTSDREMPSTLTLHRNQLRGSLAELGNLCPNGEDANFLTLSQNQFTGTLPATMPLSGSLTMLADQNRLSCYLPKLPDVVSRASSLVLPGNMFFGPLPHWVSPLERSANFLYVETGLLSARWHFDVLKSTLYFLLLFAAASFAFNRSSEDGATRDDGATVAGSTENADTSEATDEGRSRSPSQASAAFVDFSGFGINVDRLTQSSFVPDDADVRSSTLEYADKLSGLLKTSAYGLLLLATVEWTFLLPSAIMGSRCA